ncbi:MAG: 4Fe-4S binding protein [Chlorobiaceae bacterium]
MAEHELDLAALSRVGMMRQKQPDYYVMRLKAVGGDLTASELSCIASVAEKYGRGFVHLSTRQGVEIHYVHRDNLEKARLELHEAGIEMGACGPRVRVIIACPGDDSCRWGVINTKKIAGKLDSLYFKQETPSKFKFAVTGCANNCTKANENDIGIRGAIEPHWVQDLCTDCGLCIPLCPVHAIERKETDEGYSYTTDQETCINCTICTSLCTTNAWVAGKTGSTLFIGGTMGRIPRFASILKRVVESEDELYQLIDKAVAYYREHGRKKERFGHCIDRIGLEKVKEELLGKP